MKRKYRSTSPEPGDLPDLVDVARERARKYPKQESRYTTTFNITQGESSGPPKPSHQVSNDGSCATPTESPGPSKFSKQTPKGVSSATTATSAHPETVESTSTTVPCTSNTVPQHMKSPRRTSTAVPCTSNTVPQHSKSPRQTDRDVPCATTTAASGSPKSTSESASCPANSDTSGRQMSLQDDRKTDSTDKSGRLKLKLKLKVLLPKLELSKDKTYSLSFICNFPTLLAFKDCTKCLNLLKVPLERTSSANRGRQK